LDSSPAFSTSLLTTAGQRFVLGNVNLTSTDDNFQGYLDDVRVYNRALSGDEIKRLYRIGATLKINTSINNDSLANGLVGYWSMNAPDVAGTTAYDRSGNSKNGSFLGQDISPSGLVGWWKLDEGSGTSAGDSSGQGNTGTLAASPGTPTWTTGKIGQGLSFDGVDDYVDSGTASVLDDLGPVSISAWIYPRSEGESGVGAIVTKDTALTSGYWLLRMYSAGINSLSFIKNYSTTDLIIATADNAITLNTWQHITLVWDGSSSAVNAKIYINATEASYVQQQNGVDTKNSDNALNLYIGNRGNSNITFDGSIDDVRIYNRALTSDEVKRLYNLGR